MIGEVHGRWYRKRQVLRDAPIDDRLPAASCGGTFRFVQRFDARQVLAACDECGSEWVCDVPLDYAAATAGSS